MQNGVLIALFALLLQLSHGARRKRQCQGVQVRGLSSCIYIWLCQQSKHLAFATTNCMHVCFYKLTPPQYSHYSAPSLPNNYVLLSKLVGRSLDLSGAFATSARLLTFPCKHSRFKPRVKSSLQPPPYCFGKTSYLVSYRPLPLFIRIPQNAIVSLPKDKKCHCIFFSVKTSWSGSSTASKRRHQQPTPPWNLQSLIRSLHLESANVS